MKETIQPLGRVVRPHDASGTPDGELLERFVEQRSTEAFEALVRSHGPMVFGVCRRVLRDPHDAEDAFQATFLILARKAASIVPRGNVANWLYGVARRTALKAKGIRARRRSVERQVEHMSEPQTVARDLWPEVEPILDQELSRLPEKYRTVVVLCDLQGKTQKAAAAEIGWTEGAVSMRLTRARRMLAKRLARRGVTVSTGVIAVLLAQDVASAGMPTSLIVSTAKMAGFYTAGQAAAAGAISTNVAVLTETVLRSMFLTTATKITVLAVSIAAAGVAGTGLIHHLRAEVQVVQSLAPQIDRNDGDASSKVLALRAHAQAAAIDSLPRFLIRAHAGTRTDEVVVNASADPIENLLRALDEPIVEQNWFRYEPTFAWDEKHFLDGFYAPHSHAPVQAQANDPGGNPPFTNSRWGKRDLSGSCGQSEDKPATHVLRLNAAAMWKDVHLSNPNYLMATTHHFWWGDNSHLNQSFGFGLPPSVSSYRSLGTALFDGETCEVVESPTRAERLWISEKTGLIRGYLQKSLSRGGEKFYQSEVVRQIAGRSFDSQQQFGTWRTTEFEELSFEKRVQLMKAWSESMDFASARPSLLVRFRDFREIAPGIWWPFREDRAQGGRRSKDGFEYMLTSYAVDEIRTDVDLTERVRALLPKEGEKVQDQRFAVPVDYDYRAHRTETEIYQLADAEYQKRLEDQKILKQLQEPVQEMVGKPAPALPDEGWVGGGRPDVNGKPYLLHFWANWCGPCRNDFPILKKLADNKAIIIGLHPAGTPKEDVEKVIKQFELGYPTHVASAGTSQISGRTIAGYPADIFPYYIVVDAQGKVAAHGSLYESGVLPKLRELRVQSNTK